MKFWPIRCKRKWHVTHAVHGSCFKNKTKQNSMYTCFPDLCHFPQLSWGKSEGTKESWPFCCLSSEKFILHCVRVRVKDTSAPRIISGPVSRTTSSGPSFGSHSLNTLSPASFRCHKSQGIRELRRHRLGTFSVGLFGDVLSHFLSENRLWKICRQHLLCAKHCAGLEKTN